MRGRKPKPTALRVLQGNPGKIPLPKDEPSLPAGAPPCPVWLDIDAKREWRRIVKALDAAGMLTGGDQQAFAGYCQAVSTWKASELRMRARVAAAEEARAVFTDAVGEERVGALKSLIAAEELVDRAEVQSRNRLIVMLRACAELGLTPSSRTRVKAAKREDEKPNGASRFFS